MENYLIPFQKMRPSSLSIAICHPIAVSVASPLDYRIALLIIYTWQSIIQSPSQFQSVISNSESDWSYKAICNPITVSICMFIIYKYVICPFRSAYNWPELIHKYQFVASSFNALIIKNIYFLWENLCNISHRLVRVHKMF